MLSLEQAAAAVSVGAPLVTGSWFVGRHFARRSAPRLATTYNFEGRQDGVDSITVSNLSATPILIEHWVLVWRRRSTPWSRAVEEFEQIADLGATVWRIEGFNAATLEFRDDRRIGWGARMARKGKLYLQLHLAGSRRPVRLLVYDPTH